LTPLTSLQSSAASSQIALVASSQSDEHELEMPKKITLSRSPQEVETSVDQWRQTLDAGVDSVTAMDVDDDTNRSDADIMLVPDTREPSVMDWAALSSRAVSPPPFTDSTPITPAKIPELLPDTPEQLDSKSKTAQIIAEIKARHAVDSDEEDSPPMPPIPITLDSSDDSELEQSPYFSRNKKKNTPKKKFFAFLFLRFFFLEAFRISN
jgi:aryl carrier-like protein